jgi:hypothetical protein
MDPGDETVPIIPRFDGIAIQPGHISTYKLPPHPMRYDQPDPSPDFSHPSDLSKTPSLTRHPLGTNGGPSLDPSSSSFESAVKAAAANEHRPLSTQVKQRDASIQLHKQRQRAFGSVTQFERMMSTYSKEELVNLIIGNDEGRLVPYKGSADLVSPGRSAGVSSSTGSKENGPSWSSPRAAQDNDRDAFSTHLPSEDRYNVNSDDSKAPSQIPLMLTFDAHMNPKKPTKIRPRDELQKARRRFVREVGACDLHRRAKKAVEYPPRCPLLARLTLRSANAS